MAPRKPVENLQSLLDSICGEVDCGLNPAAKDQVTVREIMAAIGRRTYGPILLLIGLFSISPLTAVPGMTWVAAGLTFLIAGQMALGMKRPLLPAPVLKATLSRDAVIKGVSALRPAARFIDTLIRPRFQFLAGPPFVNLVALACLGAAVITVPLGLVPLAPLAPGFAVVLFGLGLTAKDGLLLTAGIALFAVTLALAYRIFT